MQGQQEACKYVIIGRNISTSDEGEICDKIYRIALT